MKLMPTILLAVFLIAPYSESIAAITSSPTVQPMATSLKKYKATITRKDERGNTKTFSDYCEATSYSEAQKTFEGRYAGAKVSGIIEVK